MRILCTSLFKNSWIPYWSKFLKDRGHTVKWLIGHNEKHEADLVKEGKKFGAILCMWGSKWAKAFIDAGYDNVFVICRSFEMFKDAQVFGVEKVNLGKAHKVFMLNEAHYEYLKENHPKVRPVFIKNGIDLDEWPLVERDNDAGHKVGWICNLNYKKGAILAPNVIAELSKIDKLLQVYHIGAINSRRAYCYIQNIMPYLHTRFFNDGYENSHDFVKKFLKDKRYILSCSMVEGHPMNILEAAATGCQPLIHRYPGAEHQWPENWIWSSFDELREMYQRDYNSQEYRDYIVKNYDYRETYKPVAEAIEDVE